MGLGDDMVEAVERDAWVHRMAEALKRHGLKTVPPGLADDLPRFMDKLISEINLDIVFEYAQKECLLENWAETANGMTGKGWELLETEKVVRHRDPMTTPFGASTAYTVSVLKFRRPKDTHPSGHR